MLTAAAWTVATFVTIWAFLELAAAWRDRPRPVRCADGHWRAAAPTGNGYGPRRR